MIFSTEKCALGGLLLLLFSTPQYAQTAAPAAGVQYVQTDISGDWSLKIHEDDRYRNPGAELGEYEGIPLSPAGRLKASSWNASLNTLPERQCLPLPADDFTDFGNMRIWKDVDPITRQVVAWHEYNEWGGQERTIWMDGRSHPSQYAPHTWQGFSTGAWEHNQLTITTTHLKMAPFERIGIYRSDEGTLREHWVRHGDYLTVTLIISDPVYLSEPFIRTRDYILNLNPQPRGYACTPTAEIANRPEGYVPHYLPGKNPYVLSAVKRFGIPEKAVVGGAETMSPDFLTRPTLAASFVSKATPAVAKTESKSTNLEIIPVQGNVYMLASPAGNTTVQVGEQSVIVVDSGTGQETEKILASVKQLSKAPIRWVINTSFHLDHSGGNEAIAKAGMPITGRDLAPGGQDQPVSAAIVAQENVLARMSAPTGSTAVLPFAAWPTETYATKRYELFNGEAVQLFHEPAAITDGDSVVFFRRSDVISTGDVFSTVSYPMIDSKSGGTISGEITALNHIIELTVPKDKQEGGTYVLPGHGRLCDEADVVEYRDMVTIIRDRIQDMVQQKMTLEQILAAKLTLDYDPRYSQPSWTGDMFVKLIYEDLTKSK